MLDTLQADPVVLDRPSGTAAPPHVAEQSVRWRLATRIGFRFSFLYFSLYVLTTQMLAGLFILPLGNLPNFGATGWMKNLVSWTATHVFHASGFATTLTGSGDKTIDWVHAFCLLVSAAAATTVWSIADRRRDNYVALNKWFRLLLRFAVGSTMVSYGMAKAFPLQMPAPSLQRLLEPYGQFSPMGVLWYSIGASFAYERFAGFAELVGGVLLFVPPLALLGTLITFADTIQIFTLNMTYDVPVKLFSFHLILMCLVLLAPEVPRLLRMVVVKKSTGRIVFALQVALGAYIVGMNVYGSYQAWTARNSAAAKSPLYGIWTVEEMRVDGVVRSPLINDYGRWRRIIFQNPAAVGFQRMDDTFQGYGAKVEMDKRTLTLSSADKNWSARFAIDRPDNGERMILDGDMDGHKVRFDLRRVDHTRFLLLSRGFNWVQERPFNR